MRRWLALVATIGALGLTGCAASHVVQPRSTAIAPAWEESSGTVAQIPSMAFLPVDSIPASLSLRPGSRIGGGYPPLVSGSDVVTVGWAGSGSGSATLTVDFAEDGMAALKDWSTSHPGGRLVVALDGKVVTVFSVSRPILDGSISVGGPDVASFRHEIEAATRHSHFGPHGSA